MISSTVVIEYPFNKTVEKLCCKSLHKVNNNKSGVVSSTNSDATCHNCGKKGQFKRNYKSHKHGSDRGLFYRSSRKLPKWVTKNPMTSDVEYITTATMNRKKISKNCVLIAITLMVHGGIIGRLSTRSGNKRKLITSQYTFLILPPMQ